MMKKFTKQPLRGTAGVWVLVSRFIVGLQTSPTDFPSVTITGILFLTKKDRLTCPSDVINIVMLSFIGDMLFS